jgi:ATP-dependent Lon protease
MTDDDMPSGYQALRRGMSDVNIIVPSTIAADINEMRLTLDSRESMPEHYSKAGLPVTKRALENEAERDANLALAADDDEAAPTDGSSQQPVKGDAGAAGSAPAGCNQSFAVPALTDQKLMALSEFARDEHLQKLLAADPFPSMASDEERLDPVDGEASSATPAAVQRHALGVLVPTINTARAKQKYDELKVRGQSGNYSRNTARELAVMINRGHRRLVKLRPDLVEHLADLQARMPNFEPAVQHVLTAVELALQTQTPLRIKPLLLAGVPGVGKSYFAHKLASALGVGYFRYDLSAAESTSVLMGSESHWSDAQPGVMQAMLAGGGHDNRCRVSDLILANPVVLLDEIDKARDHANGYRPAAALLALLEPSTSWALTDKCSGLEFNGEHVIYVATANNLSPVAAPLCSRFELILISELTTPQSVDVAKRMHDDLRRGFKLDGFGKPEAGVIQEVALVGNPRHMRAMLESAFARAVQRGGVESNRLERTDVVLRRSVLDMH